MASLGVASLSAQPLDEGGFSPFGELVAFDAKAARPANDGQALRFDSPACIEAGPAGGRPVLAVYRAKADVLPFRLALLESHPLSSQSFVSLSASRFLIVVAPQTASGLPDIGAARAFIGAAGQGVNYRRGIWHAPITALDAPGDFLMLMWERGTDADCILHRLAAPIDIIV